MAKGRLSLRWAHARAVPVIRVRRVLVDAVAPPLHRLHRRLAPVARSHRLFVAALAAGAALAQSRPPPLMQARQQQLRQRHPLRA